MKLRDVGAVLVVAATMGSTSQCGSEQVIRSTAKFPSMAACQETLANIRVEGANVGLIAFCGRDE